MKKKNTFVEIQTVLLLFLCVNLFGYLKATDPLKAFGSFQHEVWTNDNGLPMNTVITINQGTDGYLWLGTEAGLTRFDGVRFQHYNFENTPVLTNSIIIQVMVDSSGTVWIITQRGGIIKYKDNTFQPFTEYSNILRNEIWRVMESLDESYWIGSNTGLHHLEKNKLTTIPLPDNLTTKAVRTLLEDRDGRIWVGTMGDGLVLVKKRGDEFISEYMGMEGIDILSLLEDHKGGLWAGTRNNGLHRFWGGQHLTFTTQNGLDNNTICCIHEDRFGNLWLGTDGGGINIVSPNSTSDPSGYAVSPFPKPDAFTCGIIHNFFTDREGTLWIGTNGGGLYCLREAKITTFTTKNNLSYNNVYGIFQDSNGRIWVGTKGFGVNYFDYKANRFYTLTTKDGLTSNSITTFTEDSSGAIWFGTLGGGINRWQEGQVQVYVERHGLLDTHLRSIYTDPDGNIWAGTIKGGIYKFVNNRFTKFTDLGIRITMLKKDSRGYLWACTLGSGLYRINLKDKSMTHYHVDNGLSDNIVSCFHEDEIERGTFWIGTIKGLNCLKNDTCIALFKTDGLPDDTAYWILEDQKNDFWISSNQGIYCLTRKDVEAFCKNESDHLNPSVYGKEAGMYSIECNGGNQPAGYKTKDGKLWFPTTDGVSVIDPIDIGINKIPPPVVIEKVLIDGKECSLSPSITLPPGENNLEILFTATSFIVPKKIRFKYKMEGYDTDWSSDTTKRSALYTDLSPGDYKFKVTACNSDGVWNNNGASIEFKLEAHFYQKPAFIIIFLLLATFTILFLYCFNRKCLIQQKLQQKSRTSTLSPDENSQYIVKLRHMMEVDKVYRDPNLTLKTLASLLVISSRTLSQIINDQLKTNFYEFINQQRIKEAQLLLNSPDSQQKPILEIAYDVGYNSKSAFNRAFKYFTGMTPSEFRKKNTE